MPVVQPEQYWAIPAEDLLQQLGSGTEGLSSSEAQRRLAVFGKNSTQPDATTGTLRLLGRQFVNPLVIVLAFGALLSYALRQWADGSIIVVIVLASGLLGFAQEYRATQALNALKSQLALRAKAKRDGKRIDIEASDIVPGDILVLSAGDLVPADGVVIEARDFLVSESILTGESLPVEKFAGQSAAEAAIGERRNSIHAGTSVRSGMAEAIAVNTGRRTEIGDIARRLEQAEPETSFAQGVRQFGYMLMRVMLLLVVFVLSISVMLGRPMIESLLFAVALAVGMSPELLPAIVTVTLAAGARAMASQGVIVRRLEAIENLGSIDILCTDKTGTLTEGTISVEGAIDTEGTPSQRVLELAFVNSALETGIDNPIDQAILAAGRAAGLAEETDTKIDEIPYDFTRKRLTIVVERQGQPGRHLIVAKGAFGSILDACSATTSGPIDIATRSRLAHIVEEQGQAGFRVLGVATKECAGKSHYDIQDEAGMILEGFLLLADPVKSGAKATIASLEELGIGIKIISGDNPFVVRHVAGQIGLHSDQIITGHDIDKLREDALGHIVESANLFAEVDPQQKERVIRALQKRGHAIGYLGDGINDAPSLRAADVGISVDSAVDVARESADIVLLKRDLDVLKVGVLSGRRTFANTLKYISITTSANFGNMVSMAIATPFLPFLPLQAKQILLNNFMSDLPSMAIATDHVDQEQLQVAERWNLHEVRSFMIVFGLVSSIFDLLTFTLLLHFWQANEHFFQTAWFMVSLLTEVVIVLVLRTRDILFLSRPGRLLALSTAIVTVVAIGLPYSPLFQEVFDFTPLPWRAVAALVFITTGYVAATEFTKIWFYRRNGSRT